MSRLDSFIRRMAAQRDCLNWSAGALAGVAGPILELGLGNGRTYDHLRALYPDREIFVFERQVNAHPDCIPDADHLILGDIFDTLDGFAARLPAPAALAHADIGSGDEDLNRRMAVRLPELLVPLMAAGGLVFSDQPLSCETWRPESLPDGVPADRYFIYRT
jgi:hypothetical protein